MRSIKDYLLTVSALSAIAVALIISTPAAGGSEPCSYPCLEAAELEAEACAALPGPQRAACLAVVRDELESCLATQCRE
jgi:hypothetical protein